MTAKVLVAYGTTNGSTTRIAESVARALQEADLDAEALPAASVTDVAMYNAVVVGGALYLGRWHKDARRFVRRHRRALAARPLWFFSSGPLDPTASEREIPPVPWVRRAMTRLDAYGHVTFGGCLREGAQGRMARMILRNGQGGDFRDFDAVESWAADVAKALTAVPGR
ncbi:flavodoxin domain-containing protein [Streptomyces sp. MJP52]|uniref:flavodoxin domain-containing protein n=2 Tax=Streptomyces TaxID=1883 RepID=UPI002476037C|nr:flavodoxin domain-containing protein [Streptomyces sp. MJP52]MDH6229003.1 menaquinone-dependent protoporphyrinogen oxidase [Streptomyces sp. MJP52]